MSHDHAAIRAVGGARRVERAEQLAPARRTAAPAGTDSAFAERLRDAQSAEPLRWSAHARDRLVQRQITITPEIQSRLEGAVARAAGKGARESLVMVDDLAFVVSVRNRTVITAVDQGRLREQVFTNIDSAVLS